MFTKQHIRTVLIVMALGAILIAQPASVTVAQEGGPDTPASGSIEGAFAPSLAPVIVPGGPGFYSGNGLEFSPYPYGSVPIAFSGRSVYNPDTTYHYYETPVKLPHGATITKFVIWFYDNDATYDMWATVAKMGQDDSYVQQLALITTTGAAGALQVLTDTTIIDPGVDLQNYAYWIEIGMPPSTSLRLASYRVDYTFSTYAPAIMRP